MGRSAQNLRCGAPTMRLKPAFGSAICQPAHLVWRFFGKYLGDLFSLRAAAPDTSGIRFPKAKQTLDIFVGTNCIDRSMRIMDALLKAAEARGMKVGMIGEGDSKTAAITVDEEKFSLRISESVGGREVPLTPAQKKENEQHPYYKPHKTSEKYPRGLLALTVRSVDDRYIEKRWSELDGKQLELRLNKVIAWLYQGAVEVKDRRRQQEEYKRQREIEEEKRRVEEELERWDRAESIRRFVAAAKAKAGPLDPGDSLAKWLDWATSLAEDIDPLRDPIDDLPKRRKKDYLPYNHQPEFD
jgi:hypothetical protein